MSTPAAAALESSSCPVGARCRPVRGPWQAVLDFARLYLFGLLELLRQLCFAAALPPPSPPHSSSPPAAAVPQPTRRIIILSGASSGIGAALHARLRPHADALITLTHPRHFHTDARPHQHRLDSSLHDLAVDLASPVSLRTACHRLHVLIPALLRDRHERTQQPRGLHPRAQTERHPRKQQHRCPDKAAMREQAVTSTAHHHHVPVVDGLDCTDSTTNIRRTATAAVCATALSSSGRAPVPTVSSSSSLMSGTQLTFTPGGTPPLRLPPSTASPLSASTSRSALPSTSPPASPAPSPIPPCAPPRDCPPPLSRSVVMLVHCAGLYRCADAVYPQRTDADATFGVNARSLAQLMHGLRPLLDTVVCVGSAAQAATPARVGRSAACPPCAAGASAHAVYPTSKLCALAAVQRWVAGDAEEDAAPVRDRDGDRKEVDGARDGGLGVDTVDAEHGGARCSRSRRRRRAVVVHPGVVNTPLYRPEPGIIGRVLRTVIGAAAWTPQHSAARIEEVLRRAGLLGDENDGTECNTGSVYWDAVSLQRGAVPRQLQRAGTRSCIDCWLGRVEAAS